MRNQLTAHDARALLDLMVNVKDAQRELTSIIMSTNDQTPPDAVSTAYKEIDAAQQNFVDLLQSLTETPQSRALEQERLDTKNMVIRGCRLAVVPLLDESPIHASERSHLCLTLGMALGYLTRSDVP